MSLSRDILIQNLQTILNSNSQNFAVGGDHHLIPTDATTSKVALDLVRKTFREAASLEGNKGRIWIEANGQAYSIGHIIQEKLNVLPQEVRDLHLADEVLQEVRVTLSGGGYYSFYVEETPLKKVYCLIVY